MGSPGSQNLWAPNSSSSPGDCSQAVCSFDCQQFCILFSPPPPPDDSTAGLSPLIIAVIGVLVSGSLLVGYYTLVTRFCGGTPPPENRSTAEEPLPDQWAVSVAGLDESFIKRITVCKYQKGDGLIEGTDCAVCLSEFEENESLRLMPNCSHAFHIPCIDTWLTSQSSCPLCRANVAIWIHPAPSTLLPGPQPPPTVDVSRRDFHSSDDLILVVDQDAPSQQGLVATRGEESGNDDDHNRDGMLLSSTVSSQPGGRLLVSEILSLEEISERAEGESQRFPEGLTDHQRRFRGKIGSQGGAGTRSSHCS